MKTLSRAFLGENSYLAYPHCNGFTNDNGGLVYMQICRGQGFLFLHDLRSEERTLLVQFEPGRRCGAWDVAYKTGDRLAAVMQNQAWILDLKNPGNFVPVYSPEKQGKLDALCSISGDGKKLLCREVEADVSRAIEINLENGKSRELFSHTWYANHFHYCPHNEEWVAFAHEGWTENIPDRCWVWHEKHAPEGRLAFDQAPEIPGPPLCVGHERRCFHDVSGYAIAYAHSPAGKRGLYEIFGDGRPAKLVWHSDVLWHCTMDRSGRFVAVDTSGPILEEPFSEAEHQTSLERFKRYDAGREPMDIDVAVLDLQTRQMLYLAQARWHRHPYHPHPAISLDARWVAWNDFNPDQRGVWLAEIA